jgi:hypothetical protein
MLPSAQHTPLVQRVRCLLYVRARSSAYTYAWCAQSRGDTHTHPHHSCTPSARYVLCWWKQHTILQMCLIVIVLNVLAVLIEFICADAYPYLHGVHPLTNTHTPISPPPTGHTPNRCVRAHTHPPRCLAGGRRTRALDMMGWWGGGGWCKRGGTCRASPVCVRGVYPLRAHAYHVIARPPARTLLACGGCIPIPRAHTQCGWREAQA